MRMTSKGQVTVPKTIRARRGVGADSGIEVVVRADGTVQIIGVDQSGPPARRREMERLVAPRERKRRNGPQRRYGGFFRAVELIAPDTHR